MDFISSPDILFAQCCLIYIISGLFCGYTRWNHMCRPYDTNGEFFYPGRKQATFFFSAVALQFPYLFSPMNADVWIYIRIFGILYYPICFSMIYRRYFRREHMKNKKHYPLFMGVVYSYIGLLLLLSIFDTKDILHKHQDILFIFSSIMSLILIAHFFQVARWLRSKINRFHHENYSNEEDFPLLFAKKVLYSPLIWIGAMWLIFITGLHWVKAFIDIICGIWMVVFLGKILHPQILFSSTKQKENFERVEIENSKEIENLIEESSIDSDESDEDEETPQAIIDEIASIILQKYKNPHLQKSEVIDAISFGNKKVANTYIKNIGYYNLVNMFRLEHARLYAQAHPNVTIEDIAQDSRHAMHTTMQKRMLSTLIIQLLKA